VTFINIYSSCELKKRRIWEDLKNKKEYRNCATWCIMNDFNCIIRPNERQGEAMVEYDRRKSSEFNQSIQDLGIEDIPLIGRKFTCLGQMEMQEVGFIEYWCQETR